MKYEELYIAILNEELKKAMGCTEPIAISYLSCVLKDLLESNPDKVDVFVSGSILKNVKSVVVPNTNGLRGIASSVAIGIVAGKKELKLECLSEVSDEQRNKCIDYLKNVPISVNKSDNDFVFDIHIFMYKGNDVVEGRIVDNHTNIVFLRKNENVILSKELTNKETVSNLIDHSILSVEEIFNFAKEVDIKKIEDILLEQIDCNMSISKAGLNAKYGANIGRT